MEKCCHPDCDKSARFSVVESNLPHTDQETFSCIEHLGYLGAGDPGVIVTDLRDLDDDSRETPREMLERLSAQHHERLVSIGREALACPAFVWMQGMRDIGTRHGGWGVLVSNSWSETQSWATAIEVTSNSVAVAIPDMSHAGTKGCIVAILRDRFDDLGLNTVKTARGDWTISGRPGQALGGHADTEEEALVSGLRAASSYRRGRLAGPCSPCSPRSATQAPRHGRGGDLDRPGRDQALDANKDEAVQDARHGMMVARAERDEALEQLASVRAAVDKLAAALVVEHHEEAAAHPTCRA